MSTTCPDNLSPLYILKWTDQSPLETHSVHHVDHGLFINLLLTQKLILSKYNLRELPCFEETEHLRDVLGDYVIFDALMRPSNELT